jgi:LacI family transcriptional regulator
MQDRPKKRSIGLDEVAALAGVAKSTVSRVINGEATLSIREETRQRVMAAVSSLGYRPDQRARALRTKRSRVLGIVVDEFDNPAFSSIIRGAQMAAIERDYSLFITFVDRNYTEQALYQRLADDDRVDGVLATTVIDPTVVDRLKENKLPYVLVNRNIGGHHPSVMLDYASGVIKAVRHLVNLGHEKIAYISGSLGTFTGRTRLNGFREALAKSDIAYDSTMVAECNYTWHQAGEVFETLMRTAKEPPTAICAANSVVASAILTVARRLDLAVPANLSVISFLDAPLAEMQFPAITGVQFPFVELGGAAADSLIDLIEGKKPSGTRTLSQATVVVRNSTARHVGRSAH